MPFLKKKKKSREKKSRAQIEATRYNKTKHIVQVQFSTFTTVTHYRLTKVLYRNIRLKEDKHA